MRHKMAIMRKRADSSGSFFTFDKKLLREIGPTNDKRRDADRRQNRATEMVKMGDVQQ